MDTHSVSVLGALLVTSYLAASLALAQSPITSSYSIEPSVEEAGTEDPFPSPRFGATVAIDKRVAMASIPGDLASEPNEFGRVAVFEQIGEEWQRTATFIGTEESGGDFGRAIDIEGGRAVIAASRALCLYERLKGEWIQVAKAPLRRSGLTFGSSIELETDFIIVRVMDSQEEYGQSSVVFAYSIDDRRHRHGHDHRKGKASMLRRSAVIVPHDGSITPSFGTDLAMNGRVLAVGAPDGDNVPGSVYVYVNFGRHWFQAGRLMASDGTVGDGFGTSVAIRKGVIVVGAPNADLGLEDEEGYGPPRGNVYVFRPHRHGWYESQRLNDPANELQVRDLGHEVRLGRGLLAVRVRDTRGLIRGEDRVLVYDWIDGLFQSPQEVARYEGFIPDIDLSGRKLIFSRHDAGVFNYYVRGSGSIVVFGQGSRDQRVD